MVGNVVGAVTARCRTELGDLGLATDMARRPDLRWGTSRLWVSSRTGRSGRGAWSRPARLRTARNQRSA